MMMTRSLAMAALSLAASALTAPTLVYARDKDEPLVLAPASDWNLNYADDSCRLGRVFGSGEDKVAFYMERYQPGMSMFVMVAGKPLKGPDRLAVELRFGPDGYSREATGLDGNFGDYEPALFETGMYLVPPLRSILAGLDPVLDEDVSEYGPTMEAETAIEWFEVQRGTRAPVRLQTGPMGEPMAAMRVCTEQLLQDWGLDVAAHRTLRARPKPIGSPGGWIRSDDYPNDLLRKGAQGLVQFRLMIDNTGAVTSCHIQQSTRPEGFDRAVCSALRKRAEFEPALDENGQPIASYWRNAARFNMPR